jgi:stage II sporulation protein D
MNGIRDSGAQEMRESVAAFMLLLATASCVAPPARPDLPSAAPVPIPPTLRVQVRDRGSLIVLAVPIEDYVAATILSEVDPPDADEKTLERMYEVQAIITRTYAVAHRGRHAHDGFDLCATTHCQLYEPVRLRSSKWSTLARAAASRTAGQVLSFGGSPARAVYHADCGGHTSNAGTVWGGDPVPYLAGVVDGGPASHAHAAWTFSTTRAELRNAVNADPRTSVGPQLEGVTIESKDAAGRAERVTLLGSRSPTVRGEVFREVLSRAFGAKGLRSTLFTVQRSGNTLEFTGRGYGHGVGLCQAGAFARLQAGATPGSVLAHYFPGTSLSRR